MKKYTLLPNYCQYTDADFYFILTLYFLCSGDHKISVLADDGQ